MLLLVHGRVTGREGVAGQARGGRGGWLVLQGAGMGGEGSKDLTRGGGSGKTSVSLLNDLPAVGGREVGKVQRLWGVLWGALFNSQACGGARSQT